MSGAGHERTDVNTGSIYQFLFGLIALVAVSLALMYGLFVFLAKRDQARQQTPTLMESQRVIPPEPRLEVEDWRGLKALRDHENEVLSTYAWVNEHAGVVRIPVDRAIELLAQRGFPAPDKPQAGGKK